MVSTRSRVSSRGNGHLRWVHSAHNKPISFTRSITRKFKDGTERTYYHRVDGFRVGGKVRQRMVEYVGTNPDRPTIPLDLPLIHPLPRRLLEIVGEGRVLLPGAHRILVLHPIRRS